MSDSPINTNVARDIVDRLERAFGANGAPHAAISPSDIEYLSRTLAELDWTRTERNMARAAAGNAKSLAMAVPKLNPRERHNVLLLLGGIVATTEVDGWSRVGLCFLAEGAGYHRRALQRVKLDIVAWGFAEAIEDGSAPLKLRLTEKGKAFRRSALLNLFPDAELLLSGVTEEESA